MGGFGWFVVCFFSFLLDLCRSCLLFFVVAGVVGGGFFHFFVFWFCVWGWTFLRYFVVGAIGGGSGVGCFGWY